MAAKPQRFTANEVAREVLARVATRGVEQLRHAALRIEDEFAEELAATAPALRESAYNLLHYLAVRRHDIRDLQRQLSRLGLSSLGRMEAHVMASLNAVLEALCLIRFREVLGELEAPPPISFDTGAAILAEHATALLGPAPRGRNTRIMVTMPGEAADDPSIIRDLLAQGMNVMRINCAHDGPESWERMIRNLRNAEQTVGRSCKVSFDLAGPKLRTGPIEAGARVVKWQPRRNPMGLVTAPAVVRFAMASRGEPEDGFIPLKGDLLRRAKAGDTIELVDTRGRERELLVIGTGGDTCVCEGRQTAYVTPGIRLALRRKKRIVAKGVVGPLPPAAQAIVLECGDTLDVVLGGGPGQDAVQNDDGVLVRPAFVSCALPEVFASVRVGDRVFFDDGRISGMVRDVSDDRLRVAVTNVGGGAAKLRGDKGINLPDTDLALPALSERDLEDLAFAARHGDMVALSFVQRPGDIDTLIGHLDRLGAAHLGVVLKIETQQAFSRLPLLLLAAMKHTPVGVMVARGDLGVEVGFERLSEVQEEILWLCEAAHVPAIWATQVLESLAKGGMPSRAEVTDAAMGSRAECVMLNKGTYIVETLGFLCNVLGRMQAHQEKKTATLRKLSISEPGKEPGTRRSGTAAGG